MAHEPAHHRSDDAPCVNCKARWEPEGTALVIVHADDCAFIAWLESLADEAPQRAARELQSDAAWADRHFAGR